MRIINLCQWLDWNIVVECDYQPMIPFIQYYFQWFSLVDKAITSETQLQTKIQIFDKNDHILVCCGNKSRKTTYDCNFILAVVAEFCTDDFLEKKKDNWCVLHGAAISTDGEGAQVFLAPTGMGKSTLAYCACKRGFHFCSDDLIIIDMENCRLLPYPKPIYLRNTKFISKYKTSKNTPWFDYRLLFVDNEVKYPIFPSRFIYKPIKLDRIYIYERDKLYRKTKLNDIDAFQKLLFNSMIITNARKHNYYLLRLVRQFEVELINCNNVDRLMRYLAIH